MGSVTITKEEADLEKAVLKAARPQMEYEPLQLAKVVLDQQKGSRGLNEDLVLEAIWRLISEGKLELSTRRKLRARR